MVESDVFWDSFSQVQKLSTSTILFVGSFPKNGDDAVLGGQMFACNSLLESEVGGLVNWILLDSTATTNLKTSIVVRAKRALERVIKFIGILFTKNVDATLIFTAEGLSFMEKGLMALLAHTAGKQVILAPRSGVVLKDMDSRFMRWYIPLVLKRVDVVICQSKIWRDFYFRIQPDQSERYYIIENWIDLDQYPFKSATRHDTGKVSIIYLAWLERSKGIFDLIEAMNILQHKVERDRIELNIYGHGQDFEEIAILIKDFGLADICHLKGWIKGPEKVTALRQSNIYVLPTYFEGFPNSLMEAMAIGLPSIASRVGSIPDMIEHGQSGLLMDPGDINSLADHLFTLLHDSTLRNRLGTNARTRVDKGNSVEVAIPRFKSLLRKMNLISGDNKRK